MGNIITRKVNMFCNSKKLEELVNKVVAHAATLSRGDVLLYSNLESLTEMSRNEGQWGHVIKKVKAHLLEERGIATRNLSNIGYKLCESEEQVRYCPKHRLAKAHRQLKQAKKEVEAVPPDDLNERYQNARGFQLRALDRATSEIERTRRESKTIFRNTKKAKA